MIWDYNKANTDKIRSTLSSIDWIGLFKDKCPDIMVDLFQSKFLATMNSFIPNKIVIMNERDAPWVTPQVKSALKKK